MSIPNSILRVAKENGFKSAIFSKIYNGMNVYEAYNESEEVQFTGYPVFIIEDDKPRLATTTEAMGIMGLKPVDPNSYTGEIIA